MHRIRRKPKYRHVADICAQLDEEARQRQLNSEPQTTQEANVVHQEQINSEPEAAPEPQRDNVMPQEQYNSEPETTERDNVMPQEQYNSEPETTERANVVHQEPFNSEPEGHQEEQIFDLLTGHVSPLSVPDKIDFCTDENFLFELVVTKADVDHKRLEIPSGIGKACFRLESVNFGGFNAREVVMFDNENKCWSMTVTNKTGKNFHLARGWMGFVDWYNVEMGDIVKFYRKVLTDYTHYFIKHLEIEMENAGGDQVTDNLQLFQPENFLFRKILKSKQDVREFITVDMDELNFLFIDQALRSQVNFKAIRMKVTDETNRDWCFKVAALTEWEDSYHIDYGWDNFTGTNGLTIGDEITFYKPTTPLHNRHFLVKIVKKSLH